MNNKIIRTVVLTALLGGSSLVLAAGGKVTISSPADGATVDSKAPVKVSYEADPGPDGDHLHLYADGKKVDVIHQLKGTAEVPPLAPGKHKICLAVNTTGHVPTGVEGCVNVTSK
ncbi:conserved exported hypothetical protein [Burkholderiales bacterium]|nr:conserved exported hypothetical protein [Burkholderiales bacterium]